MKFTALEQTFVTILNETEYRIIGDKVVEEGGFWEVIFGGMAYVNLPKKSNLNVFDEIKKMVKIKHGNS